MPRSKLTNVQAMGKRGRSLEADRQVSTLDALNAQSNVFTSPSVLRMGGRRHGLTKCPQLRELSAHKRQRGICALCPFGPYIALCRFGISYLPRTRTLYLRPCNMTR